MQRYWSRFDPARSCDRIKGENPMMKFHPTAHHDLASISVAAILAVLSAPSLTQTPQPDANGGTPDASASQPRNPSPWAAPPAPNEIEAWEHSLSAHVKRFLHYPPEACARGGEAIVVFQIDRQGHLLNSRIVQSSGSAALDRRTLAMIDSVDPLPAPPNGLPDTKLSITVPIRYSNVYCQGIYR